MTEHPNAALFRGAMEKMAAGDAEAFGSVLADDVVYHQIGAPPVQGKAALLETFEGFGGMEWEADIHDVVAGDDHTIGLITSTVRAGGKELTYRTAEIVHIVDGKITERWAFSDDTGAIIDFFGSLRG